ncbi:ankyrin repeat-containing domain protein [Aspergillus pseudoustus]|uniref:Ankyrin repeat-containing domain protein n=1 Tax=Aspergillus pseudoustus TaxID=1810923 RepID=A0ABR4IHM2_9EURO
MVKKLTKDYQYDVNKIYGTRTPLIDAIQYKRNAVVDFLLAKRQICINRQTSNGQCALWCAAALRQACIMRSLLQRDGIKVDTIDHNHYLIPLCVAIALGQGQSGHSLIFHAISGNHPRILKVILKDSNTSLTIHDRQGNTLLIYSVRKDQPAITDVLFRHLSQSHVDGRDRLDRTALWHAVRGGNVDLVQLLLEKGAATGARDINRIPLLGRGAGWGQSFLCSAAARGSSETLQVLLEHGWDVNEVDKEGMTPLHLASARGHRSTVMALLNNAQVKVNARDRTASTALHEAAAGGHLEVVKLLLAEENININAKDRHARTPLWLATAGEYEPVVVRLLAEPNIAVNAEGREVIVRGQSTSLHHVVQKRNMRIIQLLLAILTINPNLTDLGEIDINQTCWGSSPILESVAGSQVGVLIQLLACGQRLNINAQSYNRESILSIAARRGHLQVVNRILCDPRADRRSVDDRGRTALWWAAYTVVDSDGDSALDAATSQYHFPTVQILHDHYSRLTGPNIP